MTPGLVPGNVAGVICIGWATVKESPIDCEARFMDESVTVAKKVKLPVWVGAPDIFPVLSRVRPDGSEPDANQLKGETPPLTPNVTL
jgi:hypothetical protein